MTEPKENDYYAVRQLLAEMGYRQPDNFDVALLALEAIAQLLAEVKELKEQLIERTKERDEAREELKLNNYVEEQAKYGFVR